MVLPLEDTLTVLALMGAVAVGAVIGAWWARRATPMPSLELAEEIAAPESHAHAEPRNARAVALPARGSTFADGLVERASIGAFRAGRDGVLVAVNPALVSLLGYDSAELLLAVNLERDVLWDEDERRRWRADLDAGRLAEWKEMSWRRQDGVRMRVRISARVVPDAPALCEGLVEDVSQRVRRDEILRRSERLASLGRTLAGVAHEINNPLAAIIGFAQILLKDASSASDRQALETIVSEAQRSARIVKDLLTVARRQESTSRDRVDLNETARYIVQSQRYAIETRGIRLSLVTQPAPVAVRGDPAQLEQVLLNLVVNARQAVETKAERARAEPERATPGWTPAVTVRTLVRDGLARVEVSDNGEGIAASDLPHIWDPFWTKRDEGEGTGLGLAVVHSIVAAHGGAIDAQSDERAGTLFTITLPLDTPTASAGAASSALQPAASAEPANPRPLDILVIDDEASLRDLLERIFSNRGHAVVTASDGPQAIRLAEQSAFDVVVCDLRMPGMDGRDVIANLKRLANCARTRFVLSTGDASTQHEQFEAGEAQVDAIVTKPFRLDTLVGAVEQRSP